MMAFCKRETVNWFSLQAHSQKQAGKRCLTRLRFKQARLRPNNNTYDNQ